jgi:hypothetical protein
VVLTNLVHLYYRSMLVADRYRARCCRQSANRFDKPPVPVSYSQSSQTCSNITILATGLNGPVIESQWVTFRMQRSPPSLLTMFTGSFRAGKAAGSWC